MGASIGGTSSAVAAIKTSELVGLALISSLRKFDSEWQLNTLEAIEEIS